MKQYLDLLRHVRDRGVRKPTRAVLRSTGEKIDALSVFGYQMRFDLNEGFPAVTTKKLAFNAVVHELLWFLSGSTKVGDDETSWSFTPETSWQPGRYSLLVDTRLEDLCGNSIARPFEVDVLRKVERAVKKETVEVPFEVRK